MDKLVETLAIKTTLTDLNMSGLVNDKAHWCGIQWQWNARGQARGGQHVARFAGLGLQRAHQIFITSLLPHQAQKVISCAAGLYAGTLKES